MGHASLLTLAQEVHPDLMGVIASIDLQETHAYLAASALLAPPQRMTRLTNRGERGLSRAPTQATDTFSQALLGVSHFTRFTANVTSRVAAFDRGDACDRHLVLSSEVYLRQLRAELYRQRSASVAKRGGGQWDWEV